MTTRALRLAILCAIAGCTIACSDPEGTKLRHVARGDDLFAKGKYNAAVLEYRNALKIDERFGEARYKLAEAQLRAGNVNDAARQFVVAADMLPGRADVQVKAATIMVAAQQFQLARKYAEAAIKASPGSIDAQLALAQALAGQKDVLGAIEELQAAMEAVPGDARPYTAMGGLRALHGSPEQAEAAFKKALEIDPKTVQGRIALAYFYWAHRRFVDAEAVLREALTLKPDEDIGNRMLAILCLSQGRSLDAEPPLRRLVSRKDPFGVFTLADVYARTGRTEQARALYATMLNSRKARARAVARMAALDYESGKPEKAYGSLDTALETEPFNIELMTLKARLLLRERRYDEALQVAAAAEAGAPESAAAKVLMGTVQAERGYLQNAIQAFTEAIRIEPSLSGVDAQLARLHLAHGDPEMALKHARAAMLDQPTNPENRLQLATALLATGKPEDSKTQLQSLLAEFPAATPARIMLGRAYLDLNDLPAAAKEFDAVLLAKPLDSQGLTGRLLVDIRSKRADEGRARLQRLMAQHPSDLSLLLTAARFEQSAGNMDGAERHLREALRRDATLIAAYDLLGTMYLNQNRLDAALAEFRNILARQSESVAGQTMVGVILAMQRKYDEAISVYEKLLRGSSRAPVAANNLAFLYAERGQRLDDALTLANEAKSQMPDDPEISDTLGWVYYKKNMSDLAVNAFEFSVSKAPANPVYRYHLGLAYAKTGQLAKAVSTLEAALKLNPNFEGADQARKTIAALKG